MDCMANQATLAEVGKLYLQWQDQNRRTREAQNAAAKLSDEAKDLTECNQALTDEVQRLKAELEKLAPAEAGTD
jgi:predicted RNase H-like nuclease (RuvC/YqgF family)